MTEQLILGIDDEHAVRDRVRRAGTRKATGDLERFANISRDGRYRYGLMRGWEPEPRREVMFVGLNPSIADGMVEDPTLRRCIGFARSWGYGGLWLGNLFAYRATSPADLPADRVAAIGGPPTDSWLSWMRKQCDLCVIAWGAHPTATVRAIEVLPLLGDVHALGVCRDGSPRHPLYMRGDAQPTPWSRLS